MNSLWVAYCNIINKNKSKIGAQIVRSIIGMTQQTDMASSYKIVSP